jgi:acyl dehydratase
VAGSLITSTSTMLLPGRRRAGTRPNRPARVVAGELFASTDVMLPADLASRYAEASGDHNPIHTDPAAARAAGLPGVVLHGMCTLAVLWAESGRLAGRQPARVSCRFANPVHPGEPLAIRLHRTDRPGLALADVRQRGRAVLKSAALEFSEEFIGHKSEPLGESECGPQ